MPLLDVQTNMRELGRIRMGEKRPTKSGKGTFPAKLTTWRLTSPSERLLQALAEKYGGTVSRWEDDRAPGKQYQLTTETDTLPIIVPVGDVGSQWWEKWTADGCARRCDGVTDTITGKPCDCPADLGARAEKAKKGGACKPTTRVSLILVGCPEVGLWRVQSTGMNAAREMAAIAQVCELATRQNRVIPGSLRLEQRQAKRPGEPTSHFVVPVLEVNHGFDEILRTLGMLDDHSFAPEIAAPSRPALPEARPDLPPDPGFTERAAGPVGDPPRPPVPAPLDPDDEVAEVEIVEEGGGDTGETVDLPTPSPSGDDWTVDDWKAAPASFGISRRDLILKAREIASSIDDIKQPSSFDDLTQPEIAGPLRAWLEAQR